MSTVAGRVVPTVYCLEKRKEKMDIEGTSSLFLFFKVRTDILSPSLKNWPYDAHLLKIPCCCLRVEEGAPPNDVLQWMARQVPDVRDRLRKGRISYPPSQHWKFFDYGFH